MGCSSYCLSVYHIVKRVNVMDRRYSGLSVKEVLENRRIYGNNSISGDDKNGFIKLILESLGDPIIKILIIVLAVKTVFLFQSFDWFETLGIVIAITLASLISALSEYGSEKSFEKLQEEASFTKCKVIRDGAIEEIIVEEVVKNDIILLGSGDAIPADGKLLEGFISIDESSFTGEKTDIEKSINCEVYRGSIVLKGNAIMQVTEVGMKTKYGTIAKELLNKSPESPLKTRLRELANFISKIGYTGAILVFISYLFSVIFIANHFDFGVILEIFKTPRVLFGHLLYALTLAVTIIIVSVPDGLLQM